MIKRQSEPTYQGECIPFGPQPRGVPYGEYQVVEAKPAIECGSGQATTGTQPGVNQPGTTTGTSEGEQVNSSNNQNTPITGGKSAEGGECIPFGPQPRGVPYGEYQVVEAKPAIECGSGQATTGGQPGTNQSDSATVPAEGEQSGNFSGEQSGSTPGGQSDVLIPPGIPVTGGADSSDTDFTDPSTEDQPGTNQSDSATVPAEGEQSGNLSGEQSGSTPGGQSDVLITPGIPVTGGADSSDTDFTDPSTEDQPGTNQSDSATVPAEGEQSGNFSGEQSGSTPGGQSDVLITPGIPVTGEADSSDTDFTDPSTEDQPGTNQSDSATVPAEGEQSGNFSGEQSGSTPGGQSDVLIPPGTPLTGGGSDMDFTDPSTEDQPGTNQSDSATVPAEGEQSANFSGEQSGSTPGGQSDVLIPPGIPVTGGADSSDMDFTDPSTEDQPGTNQSDSATVPAEGEQSGNFSGEQSGSTPGGQSDVPPGIPLEDPAEMTDNLETDSNSVTGEDPVDFPLEDSQEQTDDLNSDMESPVVDYSSRGMRG